MKDTRDLEVKRDELKEFLVDDFNLTFEKEIEDFDELTEIVDNSEDENIQEWTEDNSNDFDHVEEIDYIEDTVSAFRYGTTLIEEDEFEDYCRDLVEDCYDLRDVPEFIKNNIDWDGVASDLSVDYSEVNYQGESYLVRA